MRTAQTEKYRALIAANRYVSMETAHAHEFVENVVEAREYGYAVVCAECGIGIPDGADEAEHASWCTMEETEAAAAAEFRERLARLQEKPR